MKELLIAIVWGFIWWLSWIVVYYYNLKKDRFFWLQEKWEELLLTLYTYQDILFQVDDLKDRYEMEGENIKTHEDLEKFQSIISRHSIEANKKQKLRDKIWTLINIYFPFLEKDFTEYTNIELNHSPELEFDALTLNSRENKISDISKKLIFKINTERKVFLFFKI